MNVNLKITPCEVLSLTDATGAECGYAQLRQDPRTTEQRGGGWLLEAIAIHSDYRGNRLGSALLEATIKEFGNEPIRLRVGPYDESPLTWEETRDWYARHGFNEYWEEDNGDNCYMRRAGNPPPEGFMVKKARQDYTDGEMKAALLDAVQRNEAQEFTIAEMRKIARDEHWAVQTIFRSVIKKGESPMGVIDACQQMADTITRLQGIVNRHRS